MVFMCVKDTRVSYRFLAITAVKHESKVNQMEYGEAAEANVCQNNVHIRLQNTRDVKRGQQLEARFKRKK